MNKLLFLLISAMLFLSSCKKEEVKQKNTRIKTYEAKYSPTYTEKVTFSYNSFNKLDSIEIITNGTKRLVYYCKYKPDHSLDSLIRIIVSNSIRNAIKIECDNFKITKLGYYTATYNNNGSFNTIGNSRYEYSGDSIMEYEKIGNNPEQFIAKYKFSANIKNPFFINGFTDEKLLIMYILDENEIDIAPIASSNSIREISRGLLITTINVEGVFNNYPLKENLSYNLINKVTPIIYTYEEF